MHDLPDPPTEPRALARFPTRTLRAGTRLHRIHHARLGPFWFGSATPSGGARFDLEAPRGSSYWALRAEAAFLETIVRRPITIVPLELLDRYELSTAPLPAELEAANLPVQRARGFGLTAEIHTTTDHSISRAWAEALHDAGFRALVAIPRHDVTARLRTVAVFDRVGEHPLSPHPLRRPHHPTAHCDGLGCPAWSCARGSRRRGPCGGSGTSRSSGRPSSTS